nr:MAG TPA: hypothetical protein [Caudoviricetes sp.]
MFYKIIGIYMLIITFTMFVIARKDSTNNILLQIIYYYIPELILIIYIIKT